MKYNTVETFSDEDKILIIESHFTKQAIIERLVDFDEFSEEDSKKTAHQLIEENLELLWEQAVC